MFTKQDFLATVASEARVAKHLHTRLPEGALEYRPGPSMRSTLELLRYLTYCGIAPAQAIVTDDWKATKQWAEDAAMMPALAFPERMDAQVEAMGKLLGPISEQELVTRDVVLPWGDRAKLGAALVNTSLRFLAAYRLQLFSHAKAAGASALVTSNAWRGVDPAPVKP